MEPAQLLDRLAELAREAGFQVQVLSGRTPESGDFPPTSGYCRVRDEIRVILVQREPVEDRIEALAAALRNHAAAFLEDRFLVPALRERIGNAAGEG